MVLEWTDKRVIIIDTDKWMWNGTCRANWFNYFNMTQIDTSGMFRFLTDELQDADDAGERGEWHD